MLKVWSATIALLLLLVGAVVHVDSVASLFRMNVKKELVTVSGYSAGGTMAQQMFVSYSSIFQGVATISHAYYRCGPGIISNLTVNNDEIYDATCTKLFDPLTSQLYDTNLAVADILNYFQLGLIDDPKNMENKPLYIFAGSSSYLFPLQIGLGAVDVFTPFINNRDKIKAIVQPGNVTLPSNRLGLPSCIGPVSRIGITNCGFNAAFEALQWILGKKYIRPTPSIPIKLQPLLEFDQTEFFFGFGDNVIDYNPFMNSVGFYYIPKICRKYGHKCLLHFYFHGCMNSRDVVGPDHILNSGYLELAETNGIIMIFPQTIKDPVGSRLACWDTYAFTGDFYATQIGAQVIVVKNILDRILGAEYSDQQQEQYSPVAYAEPEAYKKTFVVSPELLRTYEDDENVVATPQGTNKNQYCTVTRVSPDTVIKRCRPSTSTE